MLDLPVLEFTTPQDAYYNYCWWPYEPVSSTADKLRPSSLLNHSFTHAQVALRARQVTRVLQESLGEFRTVYGIKQAEGRLSWEFYFYDYDRREREVSITRVLDALASVLPCDLQVNERLPYFMFSLELTAAHWVGQKPLEEVHMYVGNPGSIVSSGIAYKITRNETRLENFYFFFDAHEQLQDAAAKIFCSPRIDPSRIAPEEILRPELVDCHTICVANKPLADTVYFSGVRIDQLRFFLRWLDYPADLRAFVEQHRSRLDHLLFDVGFDFTSDGTNIEIQKSGYYGVF